MSRDDMSGAKDKGYLPYGRQWVSPEDIEAVIDVLESDWITTGPKVEEFERTVANKAGALHGVAVSNGTTALHAAYAAAGIGPGDEVIVPAITFASTANMVILRGAKPIFADVDKNTLLIDPESVRSLITDRTKAIVGVDYAGQPFDHLKLKKICHDRQILLISDAAHSLGGAHEGSPVGSLADITTFSFHPVKPITTGEGGMVVTDSEEFANKARAMRGHGIDATFREREAENTFEYDVSSLGSNYRITDFQCALGISQISRLDEWIAKRNWIADLYDSGLSNIEGISPIGRREGVLNAFHLYVVRVDKSRFGSDRGSVFRHLRESNIGVNVHYRPIYQFSYYRRKYGDLSGSCPNSEKAYEEILSLPIFPGMDLEDVNRVVDGIAKFSQ